MTISFACPECKVHIEVADEYAGQSGQCPRCQQVIVIPALNQPKPKPAMKLAEPARDEWERPRETKRSRPRYEETSRRARPAAESKPVGGPVWAWLLGGFATLLAAGLLFASFGVLVFWRNAEVTKKGGDPQIVGKVPPLQKIDIGKGPTVGRLEGRRAILANGAFRLQSELHPNDPLDLDRAPSRAKVYEVLLTANVEYEFELDSNQFDSQFRIEDLNGPLFGKTANGNRGLGPIVLTFRPGITNTFFVHVTSTNQGLGEFTLSIRETKRP